MKLKRIAHFLVCASLAGCSLNKITADSTAGALFEGKSAMEGQADVKFARASFPASLVTMETFLISSPENEEFLELLAEGYFSYAFGFLEWDLERSQLNDVEEEELEDMAARARIHYLKSRSFGFRLLDNEEVKKAALANDIDALKKAFDDLDEDDVPGLFWTAYSWGALINISQSDPDMIASLGTVEAMLKKCEALDDTYYYSGVHLSLGVFYAMQPKALGGKPEKAKAHFDIAMERHGNENLFAPYLLARYYAPAVQDGKMFKSLLGKILNTQVEKYPTLRLNNEIARIRAKFWLENQDELIFEEEPLEPQAPSEVIEEKKIENIRKDDASKPADENKQKEIE